MTVTHITGDCRLALRKLPAESVHCVMTSPPYYGLRDYSIAPSVWADGWVGCLGLEPTYQQYLEHIKEIFREIWRVLRKDGNLFINMGDAYANRACGWEPEQYHGLDDRTFRKKPMSTAAAGGTAKTHNGHREVDWGYRSKGLKTKVLKSLAHRASGSKHDVRKGNRPPNRDGSDGGTFYIPEAAPHRQPQGLREKNLMMMPARVAIALQDDGWIVRKDNIWFKSNPMPESVYDRTTTSHEYVYHLVKSNRTRCWRHAVTGEWVWTKPAPYYIWRQRATRVERREKPRYWKAQGWIRINLWRGFDYYYDFAAIMEPSSPNSHARAARQRSGSHKWADGGPQAETRGPQSIAIGSPVAGRWIPQPAGWSEADGHHGSVHPDGRRQGPKDKGRDEQGLRPSDRFGRGAGWREHKGRGRPDGIGMERWNAGGPNSRIHVDRVPASRKIAPHATNGAPRIKSNDSYDVALATAHLVPMRNKRSVWPIATKPFKEAHFATFPPKLIEPCILAGCPAGGTVLDPFGGAGTTALVADQHGRNAISIEINPAYAKMAKRRIKNARKPKAKRKHKHKHKHKKKPVSRVRVEQKPERRIAA